MDISRQKRELAPIGTRRRLGGFCEGRPLPREKGIKLTVPALPRLGPLLKAFLSVPCEKLPSNIFAVIVGIILPLVLLVVALLML